MFSFVVRSTRTNKGDGGRRAKRAPTVAKRARGGVEEGRQELLGAIVGKGEPEEVGAARVGILFVTRRIAGGEMHQQIPRRVFAEEFFRRSILAGDFHHTALCAATAFQKNGDGLSGMEGARGIVVGEGSEKRVDFGEVGGEGVPGVAVPVIDDGAGAEDLLDADGIFADNADDHVDEFVETEDLFHNGTHAHIAGVFVGVAKRDLVGERHGLWPI